MLSRNSNGTVLTCDWCCEKKLTTTFSDGSVACAECVAMLRKEEVSDAD